MIAKLGIWVESTAVQNAIMVVIIINAISLGMEASGTFDGVYGTVLHAIDVFALSVFCVEIGLKLAHQKRRFFTTGWNVFDFTIVAIALIPASGPLAVLRALRVLRVLRLLSIIPSMRRVVDALVIAIPGMGSVFSIIALIFYVAAVLSTNLFGQTFPEWFGSIGSSLYSLFQIMTLESWSMGIVRPVMEVHPWAWAFFVPFILITSFAVLNLFIGIMVDAMQSQHHEEEDLIREGNDTLHADLKLLHQEVASLRAELRDKA